MDSRSASTGEVDWTEDIFNTTQFEDSMMGESPFSNNAFNEYTNLDNYAESPGISMRTPAKASHDATAMNGAHLAQHSTSASASAESSSQDSASDSSSRRKRKVTSESPMSDAMTEQPVKQEETLREGADSRNIQQFDQVFTRPMHDLSLEQDAGMGVQYDFGSAESSPNQQRSFPPAASLNQHVSMPVTTMASQYQQSPVCVRLGCPR